MKVTTILLDIDGTLVDSNDAHAKAWTEALTAFGFKTAFTTVRPLIGMGGDHLLPAVAGISAEGELGEKISNLRGKIFSEKYLPFVKTFPDTHSLLEKFLAHGLKLSVATSGSKEDLEKILKQTNLTDLLPNRVTSDDAKNSKPDPDILLAALKKTNSKPSETILIGDTKFDLVAAKNAKIKMIGFTCGGSNRNELSDASEIYAGASDLLAHLQNSVITRD